MQNIKNTPIPILAALVLSIFLILTTFFHGQGYSDNTSALVAITSFLFGIFVSFSISNKHSRLTKINELLKIDEANLLAIYKLSKDFGPDVPEHIKKLIDDNLVEQIDYRLIDYKYSSKTFYKLYDYVVLLKPKNGEQQVIYEQLFNLLNDTTSNRKQVETLVLERLTKYEWISILALLALTYVFIVDLNTGSTFSVLTSSILATTATVLVLVLRDLDNLKWRADKWIWEPLHNLFLDLGLIPYYAEGVLKAKEARPPRGEKIRVAHYKSPYPKVLDKVIEIKKVE